jgi:very-short-patch-repair endonuclease
MQKNLRRFSTEAESVLWEMLRAKNLGEKFRRQHIINDIIVDFVCLQKNLSLKLTEVTIIILKFRN